ncbi:hypothetical protein D3C85_1635640 [compost metagenome]
MRDTGGITVNGTSMVDGDAVASPLSNQDCVSIGLSPSLLSRSVASASEAL